MGTEGDTSVEIVQRTVAGTDVTIAGKEIEEIETVAAGVILTVAEGIAETVIGTGTETGAIIIRIIKN